MLEKHHFFHLPRRLIWGGKLGFRPFSGTNRLHKFKGVKTGVIERVSLKQDVHHAVCRHVVIEHGTITIALIINVGIVTSSRYVIVLLLCYSTV